MVMRKNKRIHEKISQIGNLEFCLRRNHTTNWSELMFQILSQPRQSLSHFYGHKIAEERKLFEDLIEGDGDGVTITLMFNLNNEIS